MTPRFRNTKKLQLFWMVALFVALSSAVTTTAYAQITTIDEIFVERDTVDAQQKRITKSFRLNEKDLTPGDVVAFDIPGLGDYLVENKIDIENVLLLIENLPMKEFPAYMENWESGVVRFRFLEKDLTVDHRQKLYDAYEEAEVKEFQLGIKVGDTEINYSP